MLERAKSNLLEDNHLRPIAFVLTRAMEIDAEIRAHGFVPESWAPVDPDLLASGPNARVLLVVPLHYDDPEILLGMVQLTLDEDKKALFALATAVIADGVDNTAFAKAMGRMGKDIVATFLVKLCERTKAEAIVKIDEVWMLDESKRDKGVPFVPPRGSLADDPRATEAICATLECRSFARTVRLPYVRTKRGTGKVTDFGEPMAMDTRDEGVEIKGRFMSLLGAHRSERCR